jgi:isoleucyl-tRNA synthetase
MDNHAMDIAIKCSPGRRSNIDYVAIKSFNPYTYEPSVMMLARALSAKYFPAENENGSFEDYKPGDKNIPWKVIAEFKGDELEGMQYEQLLPYQTPEDGEAFRVVIGDFVSTEEGTGIVHIAPSFGAMISGWLKNMDWETLRW